jgi:hypothetical protein
MGQEVTGILLPGATNTATYPVNGTFNQLIAWQEGAIQQTILNENQNAASNYLSTTFASWLQNYEAGRLAWDAVPPVPPVMLMAMVNVVINPDGSQQVNYSPVPDPNGGLVCQVPSYTKIPPPQAPGSGIIAVPVVTSGNPTIAVVALFSKSTDSQGNVWVRVQ